MKTLTKTLANPLLMKKPMTALASRAYPWIVISLCSLFLFYKYILQVSPSVMTHELMQFFHLNGVGLGNLAATYFYAYLVTQLFVGPLLDKYSPRLLTAAAIAVSAMGAIGFASATTLSHALWARGLIGVGAAFATVSYMKMAAVWFKPRQFAFVGGILATAAMVGSMAGQMPLALVIRHAGWQHGLLYVGTVGLALAALFYLFVREKRYPATALAQTGKPDNSLKLRDFVLLLKKRHNWLLMLYSGLAFAPVAVFGGLWGNPFLQESFHVEKATAAMLTSMMFFGLAVGGPVLGWASDRLGNRYRVMVFGVLLSLLSLIAAIYLPPLSLTLEGVLLFLVGFGTGAFMLGFALGKEMNPLPLAATVIGLINTGDALFGALSEPLVGKVLDTLWHGKVVSGAHYFNVHDFHFALALLPLYLLAALLMLGTLKRYCKL
ncbi:MAG: MFS transporter [Gammaproteobacteria bacterium]|nr:MFS transporter [Gammaproteobacteria bacterium]